MEMNNIIEGVALNSTIVSGSSTGKKTSKKGKKKSQGSLQKVGALACGLGAPPKKRSKKKE